MQELTEIIRILTKQRVKKIEVLNELESNSKRTNLYKLYHGLKEGRIFTDQEAAKEIYNTHPKDEKYLMLKMRLKRRVLNNLFFLEIKQPEYSPYQEAFYFCNKNMFISKILIDRGSRNYGIKLLDGVLDKAIVFHFTSIVIEAANLLMLMSVNFKTKKTLAEYVKIAEENMIILKAEIDSNKLYSSLSKKITKTTAVNNAFFYETSKSIEELKACYQNIYSLSFRLNYYRIMLYYTQMNKDYSETIKICDDVFDFFRERTHLASQTQLSTFRGTKFNCYLHLRDYDKAMNEIEDTLLQFTHGSFNWFIIMQIYFLILLHSGRYEESIEVYQQVVTHKRFFKMPDAQKELWTIFAGYLFFLNDAKVYSLPQHFKSYIRRHSIIEILSETPIFSKDKIGFNVQIIILQILMLLNTNNFEAIMLRKEALYVYMRKHLKKGEVSRSVNFIKMLITMINCDFDYRLSGKKAEKYYKELCPSEDKKAFMDDLEVLLYDELWPLMLSMLKSKRERGILITKSR